MRSGHQAGTPAISSAVQFVVLNKFKKVSFILSNQYYDSTDAQESQAEEVEYILQAKPEEVNSNTSEYRRSFQIIKAKQLITDGFPGAALKILEEIEKVQPEAKNELEQMVHFFNLHSVNRDSTKDFEIDNASQRIVDSLDLISHFFNQNNYLQGITLLAAAQETFLKVAIFHEIQKITDKYQGVSVSKLIQWDNECLSLIKNENLYRQFNVSNQTDLKLLKEEIMRKLKFPVQEGKFKISDHNGDVIFKTNANKAISS
ncbi:MAG: hypothetical protein PUP93_25805 [Rhizonema sp. NSF051]|nr:hypothetical protein [Rhizonema sp. NSF051]